MSHNPKIEVKKRLGWKPSLPDHRDHCFAPLHASANTLPPMVDLRSICPPVYDQGNLGSCTGNGIAFACEFDLMKQKSPDVFTPSRLFIYYNERVIEGTTKIDAGANIRDGFKTIAESGVCDEKIWAYDIRKFKSKPSRAAYGQAKKHTAINYQALGRDLNVMKGCLADGFPFVFGFTVYESFESQAVAQTGVMPMPSRKEACLGGHCVAACGYDDSKNWIICRNSWSDKWGDGGYFYMPYEYITNGGLSSDFWTVRLVS